MLKNRNENLRNVFTPSAKVRIMGVLAIEETSLLNEFTSTAMHFREMCPLPSSFAPKATILVI